MTILTPIHLQVRSFPICLMIAVADFTRSVACRTIQVHPLSRIRLADTSTIAGLLSHIPRALILPQRFLQSNHDTSSTTPKYNQHVSICVSGPHLALNRNCSSVNLPLTSIFPWCTNGLFSGIFIITVLPRTQNRPHVLLLAPQGCSPMGRYWEYLDCMVYLELQ